MNTYLQFQLRFIISQAIHKPCRMKKLPQAIGDYVEVNSELETRTIDGLYNEYNDPYPLTIKIPDKDYQTITINVHKTSGMGYASAAEAYSLGEFMVYNGGNISQQYSKIKWESYGAYATYFMHWIYTEEPLTSFWANIPVEIAVNYNTVNEKRIHVIMTINYNPT